MSYMPFSPQMLAEGSSTAFELPGVGFLTAASRGITCKYGPVENGAEHYDVWGVLHHSGQPEFNLYEISLSCSDIWPPGFAGLWKGWVGSLEGSDEFIQPASLPQVRPAADGQLFWLAPDLTLLPGQAGAAWLRYRPHFARVMLVDFAVSNNEWDATSSWSMKFKESR